MDVLDASGTRIGRSDTNQDYEVVSFQAVQGQYYYAKVYGYNGATNPNYSLIVDQPENFSGGGLPDQFENNDTLATATSLPSTDQSYTNLTMNTSGDDDYYKITPTYSGQSEEEAAISAW